MANLTLINQIRRSINDQPQFEFNEVQADGINSSWRLTNAPIEEGSESVFVSGVISQTMGAVGTLKTAATTSDYVLDLGSDASLYAVNDLIAFVSEPDPQKYSITEKTSSTITLNRTLAKSVDANAQCYKIIRSGYTIDYNYGIIYFTTTQASGAPISCKFRHYAYLNSDVESIYSDAQAMVALDIGDTPTSDLVILKIKQLTYESQLASGAEGAIKIKQGSTSLDLTGSSQMINKQVTFAREEYENAVKTYLWNNFSGGAAVGREGYTE